MSGDWWSTPLPGLLLTIAAFEVGRLVQRLSSGHPLANPVAIAVVIVIAVLQLLHVDYAKYASSAHFLSWLLGPATVALAVPLARELPRLARIAWPVLVAITTGVVTSVVSTFAIARLSGADAVLLHSLAPKSATTPIAMGISAQLGGAPELTAALVVTTGIVGAVLSPGLLKVLRIEDAAQRGIATGTAAHGIGTASLYRSSPAAAAYSGLAMGLAGLITALLTPWLLRFLERWAP